ncbi:hypothetical protein Glove_499g14 [Diversispora epigaea]|uniref:Uncharacterized protein n=1 Tax=Diversispora epigaea TaxID=1348612 RepID=A0A397GHD7_9GLOM|nr:hypothetical protein Glove_499g14 [Diversispora epigaea]
MTVCKKTIDSELESYGFSNSASSYAGMALAIVFGGILVRLRLEKFANLYKIPQRAPNQIPENLQLQPNQPNAAIRAFQRWSLGEILIICLYHACRIVYWSIKGVYQPSLLVILLAFRMLISYFVTYDIYL